MARKELTEELNKNLCLFIKAKYFSPFKVNGQIVSQNKYAEACNLAKSTISKINNAEGYDIPVSTIYLINKVEGDDLEGFFKKFSEWLKSGNI